MKKVKGLKKKNLTKQKNPKYKHEKKKNPLIDTDNRGKGVEGGRRG